MQKEVAGLRQLADHVADTKKHLPSAIQREVKFRPSPSGRSHDRRQEEEEQLVTPESAVCACQLSTKTCISFP